MKTKRHPHRLRTIRSAVAAISALMALSACGTYEAPKPGVHSGPLEQRADLRCGYETPVGTRFVQYRCDSTKAITDRASSDQRFADDIRPPPPETR